MRLGQALLLGSTVLRPLRGVFINNQAGSGCALGMISLVEDSYTLRMQIPYASDVLPCGCDKQKILGVFGIPRYVSIKEVIIHLFDEHICATDTEIAVGIKKWTIEQLADWLEEIEPKQEEVMEVVSSQPALEVEVAVGA